MFDDGELLVVPPPQSRNSPDFELMMLDNHGYGPGYRHHTNQHRGQRSNQGYVVGGLCSLPVFSSHNKTTDKPKRWG